MTEGESIYKPDGSADFEKAVDKFNPQSPDTNEAVNDPRPNGLTKKQKGIMTAAAASIALAGGVTALGSEAAAPVREKASDLANNAIESVKKYDELRLEDKINAIMENSVITPMTVKEGFGIDQFLDDTKWTNEYENYTLEDAIRAANKDNQNIDIDNLHPGEQVLVPVKTEFAK